MGSIFLTDLANWLRDAGLTVTEYSGWQKRARGSGGYDQLPWCVMWHHTASSSSWDGQRDADYIATGDSDAPLANLYIQRNGTVWVLAAGATNTNGKGNSIVFSRGTVPQDSMNTRALGVEMGNNGVGERWPVAQVNAMFTVSNVCNAKFGNQPDDVSSHQFYAPTRKIDPATCNVEGPWVPNSINSSGSWNRGDIQSECLNRASSPGPKPPTPNGDDEMAAPELWSYKDTPAVYVIDFNTGTKAWLPSGEAVTARVQLHQIKGFDCELKVQNDPNMFVAYGPIVGPGPGGFDAWGLPL